MHYPLLTTLFRSREQRVSETLDEIELPSGDAEDATGEAATIPNKEQEKLPVAGGMGAIWFSAGGLALASAAALLYFKQRKKGEE